MKKNLEIRPLLTIMVILTLLTGSCKKSIQDTEATGMVSLQNSPMYLSDSKDMNLLVSGTLFDTTTGIPLRVTNVAVNHRNFPIGNDPSFTFSYLDSNEKMLPEGNSLFGTTVYFGFTGPTPGDTVTQGEYMPRPMPTAVISWPNTTFDISHDQKITWVPDPNNTNGITWIDLTYSPDYTQAITGDSTLPKQFRYRYYEVADNGNFTIPASDLKIFTPGTYVEIDIGRAVFGLATLPISHKKISLSCQTYATTGPVYIPVPHQ